MDEIAEFGFVSKYKIGTTVPDENTDFQFKAGDHSFKSYTYDWLVIAGLKEMFKGVGTINGKGDYRFLISAIDADLTPFSETDNIIIDLIDMNGRVVEYLYTGIIAAEVDHHFEFNTKADLIPGF